MIVCDNPTKSRTKENKSARLMRNVSTHPLIIPSQVVFDPI